MAEDALEARRRASWSTSLAGSATPILPTAWIAFAPARSSSKYRASWSTSLAFFEALAGCGVRHVCVSPGSRSTPLAVAAALLEARGRLRTWVHLDERSAAFFALGMAKTLRSPVALVCTSGTWHRCG